MECLGLHNKLKAEVHLGHLLMGPKEEEEDILSFYEGVGVRDLKIEELGVLCTDSRALTSTQTNKNINGQLLYIQESSFNSGGSS
jgi:hypothetical protein